MSNSITDHTLCVYGMNNHFYFKLKPGMVGNFLTKLNKLVGKFSINWVYLLCDYDKQRTNYGENVLCIYGRKG